jgi:hypothetical protein
MAESGLEGYSGRDPVWLQADGRIALTFRRSGLTG